jgi:hypothetical protein
MEKKIFDSIVSIKENMMELSRQVYLIECLIKGKSAIAKITDEGREVVYYSTDIKQINNLLEIDRATLNNQIFMLNEDLKKLLK